MQNSAPLCFRIPLGLRSLANLVGAVFVPIRFGGERTAVERDSFEAHAAEPTNAVAEWVGSVARADEMERPDYSCCR
jgi:hypothetical protein